MSFSAEEIETMLLEYEKETGIKMDTKLLASETRNKRRMNVVITFGRKKYIVELKLWNGKKYEEKGLKQLSEYLEIQGLETGYMLVFNFNKNKEYKAEWLMLVNI
ncbi:hypothetical protein GM661_18315 [Iocasia frigidifontis]|uniref:Uncharacterized protein n=2 Tax=Iocasia fonsfrigidae TaxID=2682810 RepID=A0A8A7KJJ3_9FIRM|nr:hypothetical protein GM661_18315 [Iocasia fonsfrigidae]